MTENVKSLMAKLKKGLAELYGSRLKAVILFGSYARGDYHEGSDLDVMIVLDAYKGDYRACFGEEVNHETILDLPVDRSGGVAHLPHPFPDAQIAPDFWF